MNRIFLFIILASVIVLHSCRKDNDPKVETSYDNGVFITNEGSSTGMGTGTISFYDNAKNRIIDTVYQLENQDEELGQRLSSMALIDDRIYALVNDPPRIIIINKEDFKKIGFIEGLDLPRHILQVSDTKAYVSQWGEDGYTGSIKVIDIPTSSIIKTISTAGGPEKMIKSGNTIYVANSGGYGLDSVVTAISVLTDEVVNTIEVGIAPNSLVSDQTGSIWVLSQGLDDWQVPTGENDRQGSLSKITGNQVVWSKQVTKGARNLTINNDKNRLYFTMNNWIYDHGINDDAISLVPYIERACNGLAFDPDTGNLWAVDATSFQFFGELLIFDTDGKLIEDHQLGVAPNGIYFQ